MLHKIISTILLWVSMTTLFGQDFNAQQKAWLYKIVMKTPPLKRNWEEFFVYQGKLPANVDRYAVNGRIVTKVREKWDLIEDSIIVNPDILLIDYAGIRKTSPGLIADASVKLALWELYVILKEGYDQSPPFSINKTARYFHDELFKVLPSDLKKDGKVHKKYASSFYMLLNPSLPLNKKAGILSDIKKLPVSRQKAILEKWHHLVLEYVEKQSAIYFKNIVQDDTYFKGNLVAVGEGSGSSGLLSEYEKGGSEWIETGTGKGIGLFTYEMATKRGELTPRFESDVYINTLVAEPTLLHLSLWGMDSNKKPLILIKKDGKSYMLFADILSKEISPDPNKTKGISYLDRLVEFELKKITIPGEELNKSNGLLSIYQKEQSKKEVILGQIETLELEIDSLNKLESFNPQAKESRKEKIIVHLSNLTNKENRIKKLEKKISDEYRKIDQARSKLNEMQAVLGDDIQTWTKRDSVYTFSDGTIFNAFTQDLIFAEDSILKKVEVKLIAASFTLYIDQKDEVQMYVNTTGGVNRFSAKEDVAVNKVGIPDTIFNQSFYFEPDEFDCGCALGSEYYDLFKKIGTAVANKEKEIKLVLKANGVESSESSVTKVNSSAYLNELSNKTEYKNARRVDIEVVEESENYIFVINGYADAVNSRLSKLSHNNRSKYQKYYSQEQSLNIILSALRVSFALSELMRVAGLDLSEGVIQLIPLNQNISLSELRP
ncbi:hypothetical protein E9993_18260 [Labilibacter sediminis]|nr:hypothetical protein E9993_18260 [Labilibacter sediminis]